MSPKEFKLVFWKCVLVIEINIDIVQKASVINHWGVKSVSK